MKHFSSNLDDENDFYLGFNMEDRNVAHGFFERDRVELLDSMIIFMKSLSTHAQSCEPNTEDSPKCVRTQELWTNSIKGVNAPSLDDHKPTGGNYRPQAGHE